MLDITIRKDSRGENYVWRYVHLSTTVQHLQERSCVLFGVLVLLQVQMLFTHPDKPVVPLVEGEAKKQRTAE